MKLVLNEKQHEFLKIVTNTLIKNYKKEKNLNAVSVAELEVFKEIREDIKTKPFKFSWQQASLILLVLRMKIKQCPLKEKQLREELKEFYSAVCFA